LEDAKQVMFWLMEREERRVKLGGRREGSWLRERASTLREWKVGGSWLQLPTSLSQRKLHSTKLTVRVSQQDDDEAMQSRKHVRPRQQVVAIKYSKVFLV
jgi:hypothetical protein